MQQMDLPLLSLLPLSAHVCLSELSLSSVSVYFIWRDAMGGVACYVRHNTIPPSKLCSAPRLQPIVSLIMDRPRACNLGNAHATCTSIMTLCICILNE